MIKSVMRFIAILSSTSMESEQILSRLSGRKKELLGGKAVYHGRFMRHNIILMRTGIGKVNASHALTVLLEHFPIKLVINCGVGGAYPKSGLNIGSIAIASKEIYGDEGVYGKPFKGMKEVGIPVLELGKRRYFNEFLLDTVLLKNLSLNNVRIGPFVTLSSVSGTPKRAMELEMRFNAICENMEGAAIAHVCKIYNIPMLEIRGVSNIAGIRDKRRWNLMLASENCQRFTLEMITAIPVE